MCAFCLFVCLFYSYRTYILQVWEATFLVFFFFYVMYTKNNSDHRSLLTHTHPSPTSCFFSFSTTRTPAPTHSTYSKFCLDFFHGVSPSLLFSTLRSYLFRIYRPIDFITELCSYKSTHIPRHYRNRCCNSPTQVSNGLHLYFIVYSMTFIWPQKIP